MKDRLISIWYRIKYGILERIFNYTAILRIKYSKQLIVSPTVYFNDNLSWCDIDIFDGFGFWLPCGFSVVSERQWKADKVIDVNVGELEEWCDVKESNDWTTYYVKRDNILLEDIIKCAKKEAEYIFGPMTKEKDFQVRLSYLNDRAIDQETKNYIDWVACGSPKTKVIWSEKAKKDLIKLFGKEQAEKIINNTNKRNETFDKINGEEE